MIKEHKNFFPLTKMIKSYWIRIISFSYYTYWQHPDRGCQVILEQLKEATCGK